MLNYKSYLQIRGCAMGTACVPNYANIKGNDKVDLYLRYIYDIFPIWKGTEEELKKLFNEIAKKHPSIKFDQKYSKSEIEFLDVLVYKDKKRDQNRQTILFACKIWPSSATQKKVFRTVTYCVQRVRMNCKVLR